MNRGFEFVNENEGARVLKLPTRATAGSAGYDFYLPSDVEVEPYEMAKVRTYIRAKIPKGEVLYLFIRSSLAIKQGLMLINGVGVIDSDYYGNADNGGEIIGVLFNTSPFTRHLKAGERFMQGAFTPSLYADNDTVVDNSDRVGGFGSTGR